MERGYAAALVVDEFRQQTAYDHDGVRLIPCPEQTRGVSCRDCGLCRDDERLRVAGLVVGFQAHGSGAGAVRRRLVALPLV
jgi:hypothetical protein